MKTTADDFGTTLGTNFGTIKKFFSRQNILSDSDIKAVQRYNAQINSGVTSQTAYNRTMLDASKTAQYFVAQANGNTVALESLTKSSKAAALGMNLLATAGNMLVGVLVSMGIQAAVTAINNWIHAADIAKEEISEARSEFENTKTSLESMNSELETTKEKIQNLESKGTLTFTEQAELEKLKDQNKELERNIQLEEKKKQSAAREVVSDIRKNQDTLNNDFDDSLQTYKATQNKIKEAKSYGYDGTVALGTYEFNIDDMENLAAEQQADILANIDTYEKNRQSIIDKYGTADIMQYASPDRELYNDISSKLQEAYKTIYSKAEYNKFVIEPVFDDEKFKGLQESLLSYFSSGGSTDLSALEDKFGADVITALKNACANKGINFDEMIGDMYSNATNTLNKIAPLVAAPNNGYDAAQNSTSNMIRDFIFNDLSDEDRTILLNAEIPDDVKFKTTEEVKEFIASLKDGTESVVQPTTFNEAWNSIDATGTDEQKSDKQKLLELAEAGKLTEEALKNTSLASIFNDAGVSIEEATEKINRMKSSADQLTSLKTGISSISNILGEKKAGNDISADSLAGMPEDVKAQTKEYEHFVEVLGNGNSTMEDCQNAANKLADAYINSGNFLSNLTSKNKEYYTSVLEEMGVENAKAVVTQALIAKEDEKTTSKINARLAAVEFAGATNQEIANLGNELTALYGSSEALGLYIIRKQLANGNALTSSQSIQNLIALAEQCGYTGKAIKELQTLQSLMDERHNIAGNTSMNSSERSARLAHIDSEILAQTSKVEKTAAKKPKTPKVTVTPKTPASTTNPTNNNTTQKESKQEFNWLERRLTRMQNIIDLTAAKLQNLFSVKGKTKNLDRQIKQSTRLMKQYDSAAKKYQAKANSIANGTKKETGLPTNIVNQIKSGRLTKEKAKVSKKYSQSEYDKINQYIDNFDKAQNARKNSAEQKAKTRDLKKQKYQVNVDDANAQISLYEQKKNNAATAGKKNRYLNKELEQYKRSYQYQLSIAKLSKDTTEQTRLRAEYEAKIAELKKEQLQNTLEKNEERNTLLDARLANASTADEKNAILNEQIGVVQSDNQAYAANYSDALSNRTTQSKKASKTVSSDKSRKLKKADKQKIKQLISKNKPIPDSLINKCSAKTQAQLAEYNASLDWVTDALKDKTLNDEQTTTKERELNVQQHQNNADRYQSELDKTSAEKANVHKAADKNQFIEQEKALTSQLYAEKMEIARLEGDLTEEARLQAECKNQLNNLDIEQHQNLADEQQSQLDLLAAYEKTLTTAADKNQVVEQEKAATSQLYAEKIAVAQLEGNTNEALRLQHELSSQLVALEKKKLDNIAEYYEYQRKITANQQKSLSGAVSELEARGLIVSKNMYASQIALNEKNRANRQEELAALTEQHSKIKEGTTEWYDSLDAIQACKDGITEYTLDILEMQKAIRNTDWKIFEKMSSQLDLVSSEYDLFIKLMSDKKMFDTDGSFTKEGTATLGAQYSKLLLIQEKKQVSNTILADMRTKAAKGETGYTDPVTLEEINEATRENISLTTEEYELKQDMANFMKERYSAELNYMQDIINKRKDLLQAEKDEYDYRRTIGDKTQNISTITKQLNALSGDDSEAARTKIQQLKVSLDEAKQDLQDTEYDRWVSDQQTMLDNLYNEYNSFMEDRMNDTDALVQEAVNYLNGGNIGSEIAQTLADYASEWNYNPSSDFDKINTALSEGGSIVNSINTGVGTITQYMKTMQENQEKADTLTADINSVATISSYDDYEKAKEVIKKYNEAPDEIKNLVDSATKSSLEATTQQVANIETNAGHTRNAINAIGTVTLDSYKAIQDANTWYNSLNDAGRRLVDDSGLKSVLDNANNVYAGLVREADAQRQEQLRNEELRNAQIAEEQQAKQKARNEIKDWVVKNKNNPNYWEQQTWNTASATQKLIFEKIYDPGLGHLGGKRYMSATGMNQLNLLLDSLNIPSGQNIYERLSSIGFADGGIASTLQKVPVANGDDGWITIKRGESVLTREQTRSFAAVARNLDTLSMTTDLTANLSESKSLLRPEQGIHSTSIGDISMNIELPNVTNYEEFRRQMQSDPKIESMFKSMIWDKGSLSKYRTNM